MTAIAKPQPGEYADYTIAYISRVPEDGQIIEHLKKNIEAVKNYVWALPEEKLTTPCAEGEWTVKEILLHIMDTERIFAYRALRIARNDKTDLPGFEQDDYVPYSGANARSLESIFEEYATIRAASISLISSFDEAAFQRMGTANKNPLSVRAAAYIIAGHELHHLKSIQENYA